MAQGDWHDLMVAAQAGDRRAYRLLLGEVRGWLRRYYRNKLPSSLIDDAVQEALAGIHQKRHTYDPERPIEPWLRAIARYKGIDRLRTLNHAPGEALSLDMAVEDHETAVVSRMAIDGLLRSLKPAQSVVIRLVKIEGYSVEEAAARTGQSISLVKVNIYRGLTRLAKDLKRSNHPHG
jgi:RNA polymerase sigma-70 factor (ECF subfamily)